MNQSFNDVMFKRKSIRFYDPTVKVSEKEILAMLDEAVTAPSSVNMQPWRFHVVASEAAKERLRPLIKFNVSQLETSAAMIMIFGDMQCQEFGLEIYEMAVAKGTMSPEVRDAQLSFIIPMYDGLSRQQMNDIVKIDASLATMQLMLVARNHGYDTNQIGGFDKENLASTFGLDPDRYVPVMILSLGKAGQTGYDSVRLPAEKITTFY